MVYANMEVGAVRTIYGLWQYDYGQIVEIGGISIYDGTAIHFAQGEKTIEGVIRSNQVEIPDYFLQFVEPINAYVFVTDGESGETIAKIILDIQARDRPPDYVTPDEPGYTRLLPPGWADEDFLTVRGGKPTWVKLNDEFASDQELAQVAAAIPQFATMKEVEDILNRED